MFLSRNKKRNQLKLIGHRTAIDRWTKEKGEVKKTTFENTNKRTHTHKHGTLNVGVLCLSVQFRMQAYIAYNVHTI